MMPVTSTQMVLVKFLVLAMLSVLFCLSSTVASVLCGFFFFEMTGIGFLGCFIALSTLPPVLLILLLSRSYIFSVMLCVFDSVLKLMSTFVIQRGRRGAGVAERHDDRVRSKARRRKACLEEGGCAEDGW